LNPQRQTLISLISQMNAETTVVILSEAKDPQTPESRALCLDDEDPSLRSG